MNNLRANPWSDVVLPSFAAQSDPLEVEVAIVGGGIAGLTCAYVLAKAGIQVAVIEKDCIAQGATGLTTAFLTQYIDTIMSELIPMFGQESARTISSAHLQAINDIESIIRQENIDCDFERCPIYVYANSEKENKTLQQEIEAGEKLGLSLKFQQDNKLGFPNAGYMAFEQQAKFHPLKYIAGLLEVLQSYRVQIFEHTEVTDIERGDTVVLTTSASRVSARNVIIATYVPLERELFFKKAVYVTYVLELSIPHGIMSHAIYEDILDPYHYMRVDHMGDQDSLILGGEDHRSDIPVPDENCFYALEEYAKHILSNIPYKITKRWQGPIIESIDGLAWIGPHKDENIFYATGFSGNGMTYSMIAAHIISDAILGKINPQAHLYRTDRIPTMKQLAHKGKDYTSELIHGAIKDSFFE